MGNSNELDPPISGLNPRISKKHKATISATRILRTNSRKYHRAWARERKELNSIHLPCRRDRSYRCAEFVGLKAGCFAMTTIVLRKFLALLRVDIAVNSC